MNYTIETEQEDDGRWIAEVMELSGVIVYGQTREDAIQRAEILALRAVADRLEHAEAVPEMSKVFTERSRSTLWLRNRAKISYRILSLCADGFHSSIRHDTHCV
jgi:predicted RNase H-like HicB family nuclease